MLYNNNKFLVPWVADRSLPLAFIGSATQGLQVATCLVKGRRRELG